MKSKVQYIALNRSQKWEGKPGYYNGKPISTRYIVVGDELANFIAEEQKKAPPPPQPVQEQPNYLKEEEKDGKTFLDIYG